MNFEKTKDDNYWIFYQLSKDYVDKRYNNINLFFHLFYKSFKYAQKIVLYFSLLIKFFPYLAVLKSKIIFFSISKNNYDALFPVYDKLSNHSVRITTDYRLVNHNILLPKIIPLLISLLFIPILIYYIITNKGDTRKRIILYVDDILLSMGYKVFIKYYIKYIKPKSIVFTNDNTFYTRSIVKHAESLGIPCFYMQHSAVTEIFPPIFSSFALLEGENSLEKYFPNRKKPNNIYFIGSPKFDRYFRFINSAIKVNNIGVCSTSSMDKHSVETLVSKLLLSFNNRNIIFRPHPAELVSNKFNKLISNNSLNVSNAFSESSFDFLKKVDVIISGNSSILLESAMLNVYPIFLNSSKQEVKYNDNPVDKYGFIKNKIAYKCDTIDEVIIKIEDLIIKKPDVRSRAKIYVDTINTKFDGKSTEIASNIIQNKISV